MMRDFPYKPDPWCRLSRFEHNQGWLELRHRNTKNGISEFTQKQLERHSRPRGRTPSAWDIMQRIREARFSKRMAALHRAPVP